MCEDVGHNPGHCCNCFGSCYLCSQLTMVPVSACVISCVISKDCFLSFSPSRKPYDLSKLGFTELVRLDDSKSVVKASELWREKGAVIMVVRRPG